MATELKVALCAIMKNEADYVEEWLAFHTLQGVSRVLLYDNDSSDDTRRRARSFAQQVTVRVIPWSATGNTFDLTQRLAYADGARRLAGVVDYTAFIDLDEFLFATDYRPLGQVLAGFPADTGAVAVNQRVFGSASRVSASEGLVTSRLTRAAAADHPEAYWFKTIARPERIAGFDTVHSVVLNAGVYVLSDGRPLPPRPDHPGHASVVPEGALQKHHYILKSREEYERKKARAGPDLKSRYTDEYFESRDKSINAVSDERLTRFVAPIEQMIGRARSESL
jgi:hypothetical protein